jgi:hypothetical protein
MRTNTFAFFAVALCACNVSKQADDTAPDAPIDADGDGFDADEDCDDDDPLVNPGASEVAGDGVDNDCDESTPDLVDTGETTPPQDVDGDGYIAQADGGDDCDDSDASVNPGQTEIPYDGVDNDCDETTPDDDLDGDGHSSTAAGGTDCDDSDASVNPDATETWYDGVDSDCDGADDYDQDGDGDPSADWGGADCDDTDPERWGEQDCRPETDHEFPGAKTLNEDISGSFSDLVYDADGLLYLCTLVSGQDYVYVYEDSSHAETYYGSSDWNMNAIALDHNFGDAVVVGYTTSASVGYQAKDGSFSTLATSSHASGTNYANSYMRTSPSALAVDSSGCIWVPDFAGSGSVSCVLTDGTITSYTPASGYVESVALDSSETLYYSEAETIYALDVSTGTGTAYYTAPAAVLDFEFDYNDDLYVETIDDELMLVEPDGTEAVVAKLSGDGKLTISPGGYLVRMICNPTSASSFESWDLN